MDTAPAYREASSLVLDARRHCEPGPPPKGAGPNVENGMDRDQKTAAVAELKQTFSEVGVVVVTRNLGLTVAQSTQLRTKMREAGGAYRVSKNRLARIALDGTDYGSLSDMLTGPVGLATSIDPVAAAKVAVDFAKTTDKFEIVGGAMGATPLDVAGVQALATLPSLDELRAKIVGLIVAPATKIATIAQAPAAQLARVLAAHAEKEAA
jgi:large subunit ribosomal protein L10